MKLSFRNKKLSKCWGKYSKVFAPVDRVRDIDLMDLRDFPSWLSARNLWAKWIVYEPLHSTWQSSRCFLFGDERDILLGNVGTAF